MARGGGQIQSGVGPQQQPAISPWTTVGQEVPALMQNLIQAQMLQQQQEYQRMMIAQAQQQMQQQTLATQQAQAQQSTAVNAALGGLQGGGLQMRPEERGAVSGGLRALGNANVTSANANTQLAAAAPAVQAAAQRRDIGAGFDATKARLEAQLRTETDPGRKSDLQHRISTIDPARDFVASGAGTVSDYATLGLVDPTDAEMLANDQARQEIRDSEDTHRADLVATNRLREMGILPEGITGRAPGASATFQAIMTYRDQTATQEASQMRLLGAEEASTLRLRDDADERSKEQAIANMAMELASISANGQWLSDEAGRPTQYVTPDVNQVIEAAASSMEALGMGAEAAAWRTSNAAQLTANLAVTRQTTQNYFRDYITRTLEENAVAVREGEGPTLEQIREQGRKFLQSTTAYDDRHIDVFVNDAVIERAFEEVSASIMQRADYVPPNWFTRVRRTLEEQAAGMRQRLDEINTRRVAEGRQSLSATEARRAPVASRQMRAAEGAVPAPGNSRVAMDINNALPLTALSGEERNYFAEWLAQLLGTSGSMGSPAGRQMPESYAPDANLVPIEMSRPTQMQTPVPRMPSGAQTAPPQPIRSYPFQQRPTRETRPSR